MRAGPRVGETIGSFLVRLAWSRGESPASLSRMLGLGYSVWASDLDRSLSPQAIDQIAVATGVAPETVIQMTMTGLLSDVGVPVLRNGFQAWLTPIGVYHRRRLRYGQLYCPACMRGGKNYLRQDWRLGSSWVCGEHAVALRDGCPHCDAPFAPFRNDSLVIGRCESCAFPLHSGQGDGVALWEVDLQRSVKALWQQAHGGDARLLMGLHVELTRVATTDSRFKHAGEPWSFWRQTERRELLLRVLAETRTIAGTMDNPSRTFPSTPASVSKVGKGKRRTCWVVPADRAQRAARLMQIATRLTPVRRAPARVRRKA